MERPVGDIFTFSDIKLIVTEAKGCENCYFLNKQKRRCDVYYKAAHPIAGYCSKFFRKSQINVAFVLYKEEKKDENYVEISN